MNDSSYIESIYQQWKRDPSGVDPSWGTYFQQLADTGGNTVASSSGPQTASDDRVYKQSRVDSMLWAFRDIGYLYARLNPLGGDYGPEHDYLQREGVPRYEKPTLEQFGLSESDLDTVFSAGRAMKPSPAPLRDIIDAFQETYGGPIGAEFLHIQDKNIRRWLIDKMESSRNRPKLNNELKRIILEDLVRTEALENALNRYFLGQKRFSLEGSEAVIPALHFLIDSADLFDIEEFVIGTTHRGRLSILNTILNMSPEELFSTFQDTEKNVMFRGVGDVKYHIGYEAEHTLDRGGKVHISLCANASHLESIDPVVIGKARALQDIRYNRDRKKVVPILLHGDAAFCGQGVVAEILNLSRLRGYSTHGTIHIIINNQIGFTTSSSNARSSYFPTDIAKAFGIPVFHVNGDDPEASVYVANLALEFRQKFERDCVIDIFCFRRRGHNEADDPSFTHPRMYKVIDAHPPLCKIYGEHCIKKGIASKDDQQAMVDRYAEIMREANERAQKNPVTTFDSGQGPEWQALLNSYSHDPVDTGVDESVLRRIAEHVMTLPDGFNMHGTLQRILNKQRKLFEEKSTLNWAFAESLAFGSLLLEGHRVRLSGEDCDRGTFSQRHLTWWDTESKKPSPYTPLKTLSPDQANLQVYDSPLSEYSIVGFEYGYSLIDPMSLVLWEAQFGDFANGAQVTIDNYIASGGTKWNRHSGLVMLLPHGIEGQGPEHSSAYLERFLKLCADDNIQVCNATTPAQYFHLLRRQVKRNFRLPLILMTPKSLLRHEKAVSTLADLKTGSFCEILCDPCDPKFVKRVLLCCGKIYYDLLAHRETLDTDRIAIIRLEQLYPFPAQAIAQCLDRFPNIQGVTWVQEESRNTGAWSYIHENFGTHLPNISIGYVGRDETATTATGSYKNYKNTQKKIVEDALEK
ncbi:MAG: 2-oxoglutarate dehydrogenase E1 component [Planctomycetota bacterium]|jgi:2-oxoglutarate dehydrogenase E1 component